MTAFRRSLTSVLAAVFVAAASMAGSARQAGMPAPAATAPLSAIIPVDPQIATGQFTNGLRYYIRPNRQPRNRVQLRLVVNTGSLMEDEDQRGLAHFVEHMAFNGTKNFPKLEIVTFLQSIGMQFGADLNASTSFDETTYMLDVPADKPEVLDKAMLVLEDWSHNLTFDPVEIDKERGVVTEEWRLGRGAGGRLQDKTFPVLLKGSRYADRLPIGKVDVIQNAKPERLTKFYADWYRPDLMAVIAVGDFDRAAMQALITSHFASLPAATQPKPRPRYDVPAQPGTRYAIASDKEMPSTSVSVYALAPARDQTTIGSYRQEIVESLYAGALSGRFDEMAQKPDAPFLGAGAQHGRFVRSAEASFLAAGVKEGAVDRGLDALFTESARVAQFGFTATEIAREKTDALRRLETAVPRKDDQSSAALAAELARNYLTGEPIPGIVYENDLYKRFIPEITIAEVNALAKTWSPDQNRAVVVTGPDKPGVAMPTEVQLAADMTAAARKTLTPWVDTVIAEPLLAAAPTPGAVASETKKDDYGITEWKLSNGARVVLKPTTFKADEIVFSAYARGGTSLVTDQDYIAATTAAQVVAVGGLGKFSGVELQKQLTGKVASVSPSISETDQLLRGGGSPKDLETLFQLINLRMTAPRSDPEIFGVLTQSLKAQLLNQAATPAFAFSTAMTAALTQNHPRARPMTAERVDEMNLDKSFAFYKERFADASAFTFFFVGTFDTATIKPLVERYLASLPATHKQETWKDINMRPPKGVVNVGVAKGIDPKAQARIVFTGPFQYDQAHRVSMRAMTTILTNRLREALREDMGGTYSVSAGSSYSKIPTQDYRVTIDFSSAPDRNAALVDRVFQEIDKFKTSGPTEQEVKDIKEQFLRQLETNSRDNAFFLSEMTARDENGEDLKDLFGLSDFYNKLDAAAIQTAAKTYLDTQNYVKGVLMPEK